MLFYSICLSLFGRQFSNFWIWAESGRWLEDTQSGFRAYPVSILDLNLTQGRYDLEIEVLIKHLWSRRDIKEVAIEVYYPPKGTRVSHFDKVQDNIRLSKIHSRLFILNILRLFGFRWWFFAIGCQNTTIFKYHPCMRNSIKDIFLIPTHLVKLFKIQSITQTDYTLFNLYPNDAYKNN